MEPWKSAHSSSLNLEAYPPVEAHAQIINKHFILKHQQTFPSAAFDNTTTVAETSWLFKILSMKLFNTVREIN